MKKLCVLMVLAGCGGTPVQRVQSAIAGLPSCFGGTEVGSLNISYACDAVLCDTPCCNTCSLRQVELVSSSGETSMVPLARARAVLDLPDKATSCEATDLRDATAGVRMRFDPDACLMR